MPERRKKTHHHPREKKLIKLFSGTIILMIIVAFVAFVFLTPILNLNTHHLYGNYTVCANDIWAASGLTAINERTGGLRQYPNFFALSAQQMERGILELPYIKTASVTKTFPNTVTVHVTERTVKGYVLYQDMMFIYIDEYGMVLEARTYMERNLPVIVGLDIESFILGQYISTVNPASFSAAVELTGLFTEHNLIIDRIDPSNVFDIRLFVDNMEVLFGDMSNASTKLNRLYGILNSPDRIQSVRGTLDISDLTRGHVFTPLR